MIVSEMITKAHTDLDQAALSAASTVSFLYNVTCGGCEIGEARVMLHVGLYDQQLQDLMAQFEEMQLGQSVPGHPLAFCEDCSDALAETRYAAGKEAGGDPILALIIGPTLQRPQPLPHGNGYHGHWHR